MQTLTDALHSFGFGQKGPAQNSVDHPLQSNVKIVAQPVLSSSQAIIPKNVLMGLEQSRLGWKSKAIEQDKTLQALKKFIHANLDALLAELAARTADALKKKPHLMIHLGFDPEKANTISVAEIIKRFEELMEKEKISFEEEEEEEADDEIGEMLENWEVCTPTQNEIKPLVEPYQEILTCFEESDLRLMKEMISVDPIEKSLSSSRWILKAVGSVSWTLLCFGAKSLLLKQSVLLIVLGRLTGIDGKLASLIRLLAPLFSK
jgi:hypothetical protein